MRNGNPEGLSVIQAVPAGQEAQVFLAMVPSPVRVIVGTALPLSELFLSLCHGAPLAPRASELSACAGALGNRIRIGGQKAGDDMACAALLWMLVCLGSPVLLCA